MTVPTVVVAEDEAIIRLDLVELLAAEGYEVLADCGRGDDAVRLSIEHAPDLVLLDIKMPGLSGIEAAATIASKTRSAVVMLTAFSQRELMDDASDAGAMAYLLKPFQRDELVAAMKLALARRSEAEMLHDRLIELEARFEDRKVIDRAKGKLMDQLGLSENDSFAALRRDAMSGRRRMIDVANDVLAGSAAD